MINWIAHHLSDVAVVSLDHDLGRAIQQGGELIDPGSGTDVASYLAHWPPACPVIVHSTNLAATATMEILLRAKRWPVYHVMPHDGLAWIEQDWLPLVRRLLKEQDQQAAA